MGIPAYFAHILRNHNNILTNLSKSQQIDYFMLDSNSIIYDLTRSIEFSKKYETDLIKAVCKQVDDYIKIINASKKVLVAFDGVAPVAKLEQQRTRRYKSQFEKKLFGKKEEWNTTNITPGTNFMKNLTTELTKYFKNNSKIIISGSDDIGEGEHKIFQYIRINQEEFKNATTFIYGLDADLIMLCLAHLSYCPKLFLYRETPNFIKSINKNLDPNKLYKIDISHFSKIICAEFKIENPLEYVFLFFLLGNDFIPHSPSLNIRTTGIKQLQKAYINVLASKNLCLIDNNKIDWKNFRALIHELSKYEKKTIQLEIENRQKKNFHNLDKKEEAYNLIPSIYREDEEYICPNEYGWQHRYYTKLFDVDRGNKLMIKNICVNYLEAIEWTFKYYTNECPDWRWSYHYNYTPLFCDLKEYVPYFNTIFIKENTHRPVTQNVQLSYVLPKTCLGLLSSKIKTMLLAKHPEWYSDNCEFIWCFCKYFWECHVKLPHINLATLEKEIMLINKKQNISIG